MRLCLCFHRSRWMFLAAVLAGPGLLMAAESPDPRLYSVPLDGDELSLVDQLSRAELAENGFDGAGRLYLAATRITRDKGAELRGAAYRSAVAIYYRYEGDLTFFVDVDVSRGVVQGVRSAAHVPTAVSEEEFAIARQLAGAHPDVATALAGQESVIMEPMVLRSSSEEDPLFGHRVIRVLLKTPRGYMQRPIVIVDLTDRKVFLEEPPGEPERVYPGAARAEEGVS